MVRSGGDGSIHFDTLNSRKAPHAQSSTRIVAYAPSGRAAERIATLCRWLLLLRIGWYSPSLRASPSTQRSQPANLKAPHRQTSVSNCE
jgi:hypothetical protein